MPRINPVNREYVSEDIATTLDEVQKKLGILPNLIGTLATSPTALHTYLSMSDILSRGHLSMQQREKIALCAAQRNACKYCLSAHSAIAKGGNVSEVEIEQARRSKSADDYDGALLRFVELIIEKRGQVSNSDLDDIRSAGVGDDVVLEVLANVVLNIFTNYLNLIADTDIDFPEVNL